MPIYDMYYVYVLKNKSGKRYIGQTSNLKERVDMHNSTDPDKARFHRTTYKKGPWDLFFYKEFITRKEAMDFERFLKSGKGREWMKKGFI